MPLVASAPDQLARIGQIHRIVQRVVAHVVSLLQGQKGNGIGNDAQVAMRGVAQRGNSGDE